MAGTAGLEDVLRRTRRPSSPSHPTPWSKQIGNDAALGHLERPGGDVSPIAHACFLQLYIAALLWLRDNPTSEIARSL